MSDCIMMSRSTLRRRWIKERGPLRPDEFLCHHCDEPRCVNFDHIFVGTQLDNVRDAIAKGRPGYNPPNNRGMKRSVETRAKIAAAVRKRWRDGGVAAFGNLGRPLR